MTNLHPSSPPRILMVDDDAGLRITMGSMLANEGYAVSHAQDGNAAVSLHRQNPFDLVITELVMDGKDGFETLMELRQHAPVRFIATAKMDRMSADLCRRIAEHLGAHSVLAKPFQPEELLAAVRKALDWR